MKKLTTLIVFLCLNFTLSANENIWTFLENALPYEALPFPEGEPQSNVQSLIPSAQHIRSSQNQDGSIYHVTWGSTTGTRLYKLNNSGPSIYQEVNFPYKIDNGSLAFIDINADGLLDIALSGMILLPGGSGLVQTSRFLINNGDDSFSELSFSADGLYHSNMTVFDLDQDGDMDLIVRGQLADNEFRNVIFINHSDGTMTLTNNSLGSPTTSTLHFALAKAVDPVTGEEKVFYTDDGFVYTVNPDLSTTMYGFIDIIPNGNAFGTQSKMTFADINDDGNLDLIVFLNMTNGNDEIRIFSGLSSDPSDVVTLPYRWDGTDKSSIGLYDPDKDGDLDLIVSAQLRPGADLDDSTLPELALYINDGNFSFSVNKCFQTSMDTDIEFQLIDTNANDQDELVFNGMREFDGQLLLRSFEYIGPTLSGTEYHLSSSDFKILPIPCADVIEITGVSIRSFTLYDIHGRIVLSIHSDGDLAKLNVSQLSAGVYIARALDNHGVIHQKRITKK